MSTQISVWHIGFCLALSLPSCHLSIKFSGIRYSSVFAGDYGWTGVSESLNPTKDQFLGSYHANTCTHTEKLVGWEPPQLPYLKLNTDGSSFGNLGLAGASGVI
ncbi:hypothetical protein ACH5RR_014768 [Cinchona calisaya]|uniref:RNase H type-1 domain-containing protein n=1 Tax=Cinchona calisaya TaxID=153742 RepID=A0ABD2ZR75_9GENT